MSLIALGVAIGFALHENKRAHHEMKRAIEAEGARRRQEIELLVDLAETLIGATEATLSSLKGGHPWEHAVLQWEPVRVDVLSALDAVRGVISSDAVVVIEVARVWRHIASLPRATFIHQVEAVRWMESYLAEVVAFRSEIVTRR